MVVSKNKIIKKNKASYDDNLVNAIKILGILLLLFGIIYVGTAIVTGEIKLKEDKETKEEVTIQNEEILAGSTFNMHDDDYMVLYYDYTDVDASVYDELYNNYSATENEVPKMYKVDLSKGFNKGYVSEKKSINKSPSSVDNLELKNPTLIRITNHKVVKLITSDNEIREYINKLI